MSSAYGVGNTNYGGEAGLSDDSFMNMSAFENKSVRLAFIRKVYSILSVQLLVTFGVVLIFAFSEESKSFARGNLWLMWIGFAGTIVTIIALTCFGDLRRRFPHNFILLGLFTMAESLVLGILTAHYDTKTVVMAIGVTAVVCIALTAFAFQTKIDFTVYYGAAYIFFIVLFMMGLVCMFVDMPILHMVYSCLGALLFSFFLLIDTQMIVGGSRSLQISPEEYILAVITLYLDIIQLFLYILQIFNGSK